MPCHAMPHRRAAQEAKLRQAGAGAADHADRGVPETGAAVEVQLAEAAPAHEQRLRRDSQRTGERME